MTWQHDVHPQADTGLEHHGTATRPTNHHLDSVGLNSVGIGSGTSEPLGRPQRHRRGDRFQQPHTPA